MIQHDEVSASVRAEHVEALIKAGANLQLADRASNTPLTLARQKGFSAMVRMLEAAGVQ